MTKINGTKYGESTSSLAPFYFQLN